MTPGRLAWRTLTSQWRLGVLTTVCVAISASVIVGAWTVGDSVRGALWRRLVAPLGAAEYALANPTPLSAQRTRAGVAATLRLAGSASNQRDEAVGGVTAWGVDDRFHDLVPDGPLPAADGEAWITPALARDLGLGKGDPLFLSLPKLAVAPQQAVFGRRAPSETTVEVVATVAGVLPESGVARFSLNPSFRPLRGAFLRRSWLAARLGRPDAANVLLGKTRDLANGFGLADDGLHLVQARRAGGWVLQSDQLVLRDDQIAAAQKAADGLGVRSAQVSITLATTLEAKGRSTAYAVAAWVDGVAPALNAWAAEDLQAGPGQVVGADVLVARPDGGFGVLRADARLGPTLPMSGIGAEPALVPEVEGVTDAQRVDQWDPPFPFDARRITQRDEAYWDAHRAAPRLFLTQEQLRKAWGGDDFVTGVWIRGGTREELESEIGSLLFAGDSGRRPVPIRDNAILAARGSTNMAMLVMALGAFVLAGALGLAATAFALAVRQQARAYAILSATGVRRRAIVATVGIQGALLASVGGLLGVPGGVGFAWAALGAMRRLMPPDLGFEAVTLEVRGVSLVCGGVLAAAIALASLARTVRAVGQGPVVPVLRGREGPSRGGFGRGPAVGFALVAAGCFAGTLWLEGPARGLLGGAGAFCLACGAVALALAGAPRPAERLGWFRMLLRQIRDTGSSVLLGVVLSGLATFVLCAVAGHLGVEGERDERLLVSTSVPVRIDLGSEEGRRRLGFTDEELADSKGTQVTAFLRSPGDDVSCLNPAKPVNPRFLGVSRAAATLHPFEARPGDAWERLLVPVPPSQPVPALADADTVAWTFESGVGKTIPWSNAREARFVGVLVGSALAREILIPEAEFRNAYPSIGSPSFFIVAAAAGRELGLKRALARTLAPLGVEIRTVREEVRALRGVQEAYMAIFLALGSLGLLLGIVGTAFVSLREAAARRARYALLQAIGLRRSAVALLAIVPGIASALLGVLIGAAACAVGSPQDFAWGPVAVVGACILAVLAAVNTAIGWGWRRDVLVEALRSE